MKSLITKALIVIASVAFLGSPSFAGKGKSGYNHAGCKRPASARTKGGVWSRKKSASRKWTARKKWMAKKSNKWTAKKSNKWSKTSRKNQWSGNKKWAAN